MLAYCKAYLSCPRQELALRGNTPTTRSMDIKYGRIRSSYKFLLVFRWPTHQKSRLKMAENSTEPRTAPEPASKEERASDAPPIMDPPVSAVCLLCVWYT